MKPGKYISSEKDYSVVQCSIINIREKSSEAAQNGGDVCYIFYRESQMIE